MSQNDCGAKILVLLTRILVIEKILLQKKLISNSEFEQYFLDEYTRLSVEKKGYSDGEKKEK